MKPLHAGAWACCWPILYDTIALRFCIDCANVRHYLASAIGPVALQCGLCCLIIVPFTMLTFGQAPLCSAGCICPCGGALANLQLLVGQGSCSIAPGLVVGLPLQAIKPTVELQTI